MRYTLKQTAAVLALVLTTCAPAALAKTKKPKPSAARVAAIRKCDADYQAALRATKSQKGKERKDARAAARQARKQCVADAPM